MPLLLVTGLPSSGKSTVIDRIASYLSANGLSVNILREAECQGFERKKYNDSKLEKQWRASIRRDTGRLLSGNDSVLIVDALNYVKGYRYELFIQAKNLSHPYAVVFVNADVAMCHKLNEESGAYEPSKIDELAERFETPIGTNRWDSPLFTINITPEALPRDVDIEFSSISESLSKYAKLKPNPCTIAPVEHSVADLNQVEKRVHEMTKEYFDKQRNAVFGDLLMLSHVKTGVPFKKHRSLAEMGRLRTQFMNLMKQRKITDLDSIGLLYVDFLSTA
uniref:Protein KTI12 homolog n=1 Tax=Panagrellus redivivus TaxID=6233 RepID=A0A7E4W996_PANRE